MDEPRRVRLDEHGNPIQPLPVAEPEPCACPHLDAEDWDGVENDWTDIAFLQVTVPAVMGVPVGFAAARQKLKDRAAELGARVPEDGMLLLGSGKFRRSILLEIEDAPDVSDVVRPGGVAFTRLRAAPWGEMRGIAEQVEDEARQRFGRKPDRLFIWYLTCRVCSGERDFETLFVAHYKKLS